ncbi:MAG: hypothetical protein LIR50_19280 [Bacillota bacterium]|nr:hypothetical protein [Bacillota bacterium]
MEKIKVLNESEIKRIRKAADKGRALKNILGIKGYTLGDTATLIDNSEMFGLYKNEWKGDIFYYLVMDIMNEKLAYCYSLYPTVY